MLNVLEIEDKKIWESLLTREEVQFYPLFQSWNWGDVQKSMGYKIWRMGVYKGLPAGRHGKNLVAICQIVDINARRGHYIHLRHGPVLLPFDQEVFDYLITYVKKLGQQIGASFIRISPIVKKEHVNSQMLKDLGFRNAPIHNMDAEICWVLDIDKSEEQLLKEMRKTHRYLIKKALSMDIEIVRTKKVSDIEDFLQLYKDLSTRKHFVPHRGVKEEFAQFSKDDEEFLLLAKYKGKIISGALVLFAGNMAIYRHGASDVSFKEIPASYLLQWEAILEAKRRGKKIYNFWGIAPEQKKNHPWHGLTLFKMGFGGHKLEFLHAQDLPLNLTYWKMYAIESITKLLKGY